MGAMRWGNKENKWKKQTERERYRERAYIEVRNKKEKERHGDTAVLILQRGEKGNTELFLRT